MGRYSELENRWLKYKIKTLIYKLIIPLFVILILLLIYFFIKDGVDTNQTIIETNTTTPESSYSSTSISPELNKTLKADFGFVDRIKDKVQKEGLAPPPPPTTKIDLPPPIVIPASSSSSSSSQKSSSSSTMGFNLQSKEMNTKADKLELLESKFKQSNDIKDALELSREFYKVKNYPKALNWAIIANGIDSKNADSWIMFAKSKYKIGDRGKAIEALEIFSKTSNSTRDVLLVLEAMKRGILE